MPRTLSEQWADEDENRREEGFVPGDEPDEEDDDADDDDWDDDPFDDDPLLDDE